MTDEESVQRMSSLEELGRPEVVGGVKEDRIGDDRGGWPSGKRGGG